MPALPPVTQTLRIALNFNIGGALAGSRFFMSYTGGPPNQADITQFAGDLHTNFTTNFGAWYPASIALVGTNVLDLNTSSGREGIWAGNVPGTLAGLALPANCCTVVDFVIPRKYRGGKPRIYLPVGGGNEQADGSHWLGSFVTAINGAWGSFVSALQARSYSSFTPQNHVNVSYYSGYNKNTPPWRGPGYAYPPQVRPGPITPDLVSNHATRTIVGSQRRRLGATGS